MGIKADIDEVMMLWNKASPLMKVFLGISLFLTVSSVASLSNAVFAWKGFILDGIEFYRNWIGAPISKITKYIGFKWNKQEIDFLVIGSIFYTCHLRELWISFRLSKEKSDFWEAVFWSVFLLSVLVFVGYRFASPINVINWKWFLSLMGVAFLGVLFLYSPRERAVYFLPIIISVLFVLVLGAINAGLKK